jgi:hypothetical protein
MPPYRSAWQEQLQKPPHNHAGLPEKTVEKPAKQKRQ